MSASDREVLERRVFVGADLAGKAEDALGDDVLQDFISAAGDA
jgi:hypothetical protein